MSVGKHSRLFVRECPTLWGGYVRNPFREKGSLRLLSFAIFPLQKQRKVEITSIKENRKKQSIKITKNSQYLFTNPPLSITIYHYRKI